MDVATTSKFDEIVTSTLVVFIQLFVAVGAAIIDFRFELHLDPFTYGAFRDVNIMIFFGFGFLMTFLYRHGLSAVGFCMVISALVVEASLVVRYLILDGSKEVGIHVLLDGLFCAGAVMITFGAVLGKVTPLQLSILAFIEVFAFFANVRLVLTEIGAHDVGGGLVIHSFGAYFGLAATWWITANDAKDHPLEKSNYISDLFSLAGTVFLWVLWPSFQAAVAGTQPRQMAAASNTFFSLCSSTLAFFVVSRALSGHRFSVVHLQNATLAGGVVMGTAGDMHMAIYGSMIAGFIAGVLSCVGYAVIQPVLLSRLGIHDTCGVNNLHGMPGVLSGILAIILVAMYGDGSATADGVNVNKGFTNVTAVKQLYGLLVSVGMGLLCGFLTGAFVTVPLRKFELLLTAEHFYSDELFFECSEEPDEAKAKTLI